MIYIACRSCTSGHHASTGPCRLYDGDGNPCACRVCAVPDEPSVWSTMGWAWLLGVALVAAAALIFIGVFAYVVLTAVTR